ncbi:hypothetical protein V5P93_003945 [Actinokineospora auranticolor]|uniref:hypothetical protein n=1 Tax=Actinokineospora auranticolor TaxID=155976 RepID=UPI0011AFE572|nr:hypothetical protein [Actinokineospora auranticolor]
MIAALSSVSDPAAVTASKFDGATNVLLRDCLQAALVVDKQCGGGFWRKASYSLFPNSPMNHPGNAKKSREQVGRAVRAWFTLPEAGRWPGVPCVLCGRAAVGFFGKMDVALAESESYRNSTPPGHEGMSLCWPCLICFRAYPYGCRLTGGPSSVVHSWDESFLAETVRRQVDRTAKVITIAGEAERPDELAEVIVVEALKSYRGRIRAGVELMVVNNNNRGQLLRTRVLDQPLAEWLRRRSRHPAFGVLEQAQASSTVSGQVGLARTVFARPPRLVTRCVSPLLRSVIDGEEQRDRALGLIELLRFFVVEVMLMKDKDLAEIDATARKIASKLKAEDTGGKLRAFRSAVSEPRKLRRLLSAEAVVWAIDPWESSDEPFISRAALTLLFDPDPDNSAWFHREYLLIGVLAELKRFGWVSKRPEQDKEGLDTELADDELEVS